MSESRERFEKWANAKGTMGNSWNGEYYQNNLHEAAWQAWQAAERETGERCAQEYKELSGYSFQQAVFEALRTGGA